MDTTMLHENPHLNNDAALMKQGRRASVWRCVACGHGHSPQWAEAEGRCDECGGELEEVRR